MLLTHNLRNALLCAATSLSVLAFATPASAIHPITEVTTIDSIDGTGLGTFSGSISSGDGDIADWFTFHAEIGDSLRIETIVGTNFDTVLSLYHAPGTPTAGMLIDDLTLVARDDDGGPGLLSLIDIPSLSLAGHYVFAVSPFNHTSGNFTVQVSGTVDSVPTAVPEPLTLSLMGGGLLGLAFIRRRRS